MEPKVEIIIFWSAEDDAFVAEVPELLGCMADGKSAPEALANPKQVIQEWVETAEALGRLVPQPKGRLTYAWQIAAEGRVATVLRPPVLHRM